jgi:hypothetical protein
MFNFPCLPIIKALLICVAGFKRASDPRQVFQEFAKLVVSYSYGIFHDLYRRITSKLLPDPAMPTIR